MGHNGAIARTRTKTKQELLKLFIKISKRIDKVNYELKESPFFYNSLETWHFQCLKIMDFFSTVHYGADLLYL